jgi:hypothetical protein
MAAAKKRKKKKRLSLGRTGTSSGHITNLKQSILDTFEIYVMITFFVYLFRAALYMLVCSIT